MKNTYKFVRKSKQKINLMKSIFRNWYYRNGFKQCGKNLRIGGDVKIFFEENIICGDNVRINENSIIDARGGVTLESGVTLSGGVTIVTGYLNHTRFGDLELHQHSGKEVFIGKGAWLCMGAIICPGVHIIGENVIVAAGAVVTKDIADDNVIVAGIPAKVIRRSGCEDKTL